jgi:predicted DNA-binding transcriptional regulator YafY
VVDAFVRHRRLLVRYRSNDGGHTRDRVIDPYRVFKLAGVWYVAAFDDRRRTVRNFALHRIRGATVTEEAFTPDPSFDFAAYREGTFGIERGTVPLNVAIRFGSHQARWIRERAWLSPVATPGHH